MSDWQPYLRTAFPQPTDEDRTRLEYLAGAALPDAYWRMVGSHQGEVLDTELELEGEGAINFGVLLLALSPLAVERQSASYCVEYCFEGMQDRYPAGLFPFADDTGGNYWAFDFRTNSTDPAIVFIDHEMVGDAGVTAASESFAAFMASAGAPGF
ncbi:hypothetical protein A6U86_04940 [Rhizobium sp. AC27/96]|uniref:SMI1/KNR4 family protein n=1 Tax=Rhizobium sp. AC27/96 TaxID=1841653 RepID=UPI000827D865|nr:SMI1/KNR4 family protein [Rhizobium sp. AC27/96]OCJ12372.1 hypothetical protein A6U86_04940 [Rhizobium sp. AC27/96]